MSFTSLEFIVFFLLTSAVHFLAPARVRWVVLLVASSGFYAAFVPRYLLLLYATIAVDYVLARAIAGARGRPRMALLVASVASNVGVLAVFKYADFFLANVDALSAAWGSQLNIPALKLILPIGLSFHIFQSLGYVIDVYRRKIDAERHLGRYALYVMFFPQLVAGPIERAGNLLPQLANLPDFDGRRVERGLRRMAWGYFKKMVVADRLALAVAPAFAHPHDAAGLPVLLAACMFSFQIYGDFSGYTDIALGAAEVYGVRLMENFDRPYLATSVADFWRRWHISLSTWFRDYVYLPLGGNRVSTGRWTMNIGVVFLLSGLWHGANWTYVAWGALHAGYMVLGRFLGGGRMAGSLAKAGRVARTFSLVTIAWICFRAATISDAVRLLGTLPGALARQVTAFPGLDRVLTPLELTPVQLGWDVFFIGVVVTVEAWLARPESARLLMPAWGRLAAYNLCLLAILLLAPPDPTSFIYFQF